MISLLSLSTDLNVLDFVLFSSIQALQYKASRNTIDDLMKCVEKAIDNLDRETLDNVSKISNSWNQLCWFKDKICTSITSNFQVKDAFCLAEYVSKNPWTKLYNSSSKFHIQLCSIVLN